MDERKSVIKDLEDNKRALIENRNRLITDLGGNLIKSIGDNEPFQDVSGDGPGALLVKYRRLKKDIAESAESIKSLEGEIKRLKELDEKITAQETELSLLTEELEQVNVRLGMALLNNADSSELASMVKQQEESLLAKIAEHEKGLEELEEQKGGIFSWLGKNAKIAVEKALLSKSRSDLQKLYRNTGEEFSAEQADILEGETAETAEKSFELKEKVSSLDKEMALLKGERRKLGGVFGSDASPSRRIQGYEKQISQMETKEIPDVYFHIGSLAADSSGGKEPFSSYLGEKDFETLKEVEKLASEISEKELEIKKVKAAIDIDKEKAEIEKFEKAILEQKRKISAVEDVIRDLEKQIAESGQYIEKLNAFIQGEHGS